MNKINNKNIILLITLTAAWIFLLSVSVTADDDNDDDTYFSGNYIKNTPTVTLQNDNKKYGQAGATLVFPHRIVNRGNLPDTFTLTRTAYGTQNFTLSNITIYPDTDNDGIADSGAAAITATPSIISGGIFSFVIHATVPAGTANNKISQIRIKATSTLNTSVYDTNIDTANTAINYKVSVTKTISAMSGTTNSGPYTITLKYKNTGTTTANNLIMTDSLSRYFVYVSNSGRWSANPSIVLDTTNDPGILYSYNKRVVKARIYTLLPGAEGTVSFQVTVPNKVTVGIISNYAVYNHDGLASENTNITSFRIRDTVAFTATGQTISDATPGQTISFANSIKNTGNISGTFEITTNSSTFPSGTTYALYASNGVALLTDTNGNGTPDTGILTVNQIYYVILKVTLPANTTGGPYTINKKITSYQYPDITATATDTLSQIVTASVYVSDKDGFKDNTNLLSSQIINTGPETTITYQLKVKNNSTISDNYNLIHTLTIGTVIITNASTGAVITNTGTLTAGTYLLVNMSVTLPSNLANQSLNFIFRANSATNSSTDFINLKLNIATTRQLQVSPLNSGQTNPGGSITYSHSIQNNGNITETGITLDSVNSNPSFFSNIIYIDSNNNGMWDTADTKTNIIDSLAKDESKTFFNLVFCTPNTTEGMSNVTTITASAATINMYPLSGNLTVTDFTSASTINIRLDLYQKLSGAGNYVMNTISQFPNAIIRYKLMVTNISASLIPSISINISLPPNTSFFGDGTSSIETGNLTIYRNGISTIIGSVPYNYEITNLMSGEAVIFYYGVRVNPN